MKIALIIIVSVLATLTCCIVSFIVLGSIASNNETALDDCLDRAYDSYVEDWNQACGANDLPKDCNLPIEVSDSSDRRYEQAVQNCYVLYK